MVQTLWAFCRYEAVLAIGANSRQTHRITNTEERALNAIAVTLNRNKEEPGSRTSRQTCYRCRELTLLIGTYTILAPIIYLMYKNRNFAAVDVNDVDEVRNAHDNMQKMNECSGAGAAAGRERGG